jgi:hypothetical protein
MMSSEPYPYHNPALWTLYPSTFGSWQHHFELLFATHVYYFVGYLSTSAVDNFGSEQNEAHLDF